MRANDSGISGWCPWAALWRGTAAIFLMLWSFGDAHVQAQTRKDVINEEARREFLKALYTDGIDVGRVFPRWNRVYHDRLHRTIWAVGDGGTVASSIDGGKYWRFAATGVEEDLHNILVLPYGAMPIEYNGPNGWIVGENGTVLTSRDFGRSWQRTDRITVLASDGRTVGARLGDLWFSRSDRFVYTAVAKRAPHAEAPEAWVYRLNRDGKTWRRVPSSRIRRDNDSRAFQMEPLQNGSSLRPPTITGTCHVSLPSDGGPIELLYSGGRVSFEFGRTVHGGRVLAANSNRSCDGGGPGTSHRLLVRENSLVRENRDGRLDWISYPDLKKEVQGSNRVAEDTFKDIIQHAWHRAYRMPGVALTNGGLFFKPEGAGTPWQQIVKLSGPGTTFRGVTMSPLTGRIWLVGDNVVQGFDDNGQKLWDSAKTGSGLPDMALNRVALSDDGEMAWIVGDNGQFLRTDIHARNLIPIPLQDAGPFGNAEPLRDVTYHEEAAGGLVVGKGGVFYFKETRALPDVSEVEQYTCRKFLGMMDQWHGLGQRAEQAARDIQLDCLQN